VKKVILLLSVFIMACSKPTGNRDKAILSIQQYVKTNFPYPDSYQNIKYGKLDSAYEYPDTLDIQIEDLREAILIEHQADSVQSAIRTQLSQMGIPPQKNDTNSTKFKDKLIQYQNKLNTLLASPKEKHYYISDKHQAKNKQGILEGNTINYEMDTTFKIIDTN
jgi:hypothetical protein